MCYCYDRYCCCKKKEEKIHIPIITAVVKSNWIGVKKKVMPADYITLSRISMEEANRIQEAASILSKHGIYFFQEKI